MNETQASKITHAITTIVGSMARPESYNSVTNQERSTLKQMAEHVAAQGVLMADLSSGSNVERMGGDGGGLRVAMPTPVAQEKSYQAATRVRRPLQVEKAVVPKSLKGREIELARFSAANGMGGGSVGGPEMVLGLFDVESVIAGINISVHVPTNKATAEAAKPPTQPSADGVGANDHFPQRPSWHPSPDSEEEEEEEQEESLIPDPTSPDRQKPMVHHSLVQITVPVASDFSPFLIDDEDDILKLKQHAESVEMPSSNVSFFPEAPHPDVHKSDRSSPGLTRIRSMTRSSPSFGRMASFSSRKIVQESPVIKVEDEDEDDDPLIRRLLQESREMNRSRSASPHGLGRSSLGGSLGGSVGAHDKQIPALLPPLTFTQPHPLTTSPAVEPMVSARELWVRGDVHDPSGLTSSHLGKLVTEAARKVYGDQPLPPVKISQPAFATAAKQKSQSAAALARKMINSKVGQSKLPVKRDPFRGLEPLGDSLNEVEADEAPAQSVESLMEKESMYITMSTPPKLDDLTGPDPLGLNKAAKLRNESIQQQMNSSKQREDEARAMALKKVKQVASQPKLTTKRSEDQFDVPAFHSSLGFISGMEVEGGMIYYN